VEASKKTAAGSKIEALENVGKQPGEGIFLFKTNSLKSDTQERGQRKEEAISFGGIGSREVILSSSRLVTNEHSGRHGSHQAVLLPRGGDGCLFLPRKSV